MTAIMLDFIRIVADFMGAESSTASEIRFERNAGLNWERVHNCLLFPRSGADDSACYGEEETLFNHSTGNTEVFNKRTPSSGFKLLASCDMRRRRQACAGVYSYGPYLSRDNKMKDGLLLAHIFLPAGLRVQEAMDALRHALPRDRLRYGIASFDDTTINLFCLRHSDDAATETHT